MLTSHNTEPLTPNQVSMISQAHGEFRELNTRIKKMETALEFIANHPDVHEMTLTQVRDYARRAIQSY